MKFFILLSLVASSMCDGGEHHHHAAGHSTEQQYAAPAPAQAETYGAPAPADTYGAPHEVPVYSAPTPQYAAPSLEYGAPQEEYGVPSQEYGAPAQEYAAAAEYGVPEYNSHPTYEEHATTYQSEEHTDLGWLLELIPLILAVLAAVIVAQIFAPLLGVLFGAKFTLLSGLFSPVGNMKVGILNAALAPFNVAICDISTTTPTVISGRDSNTGFSVNQDTIDLVANMLYKAIDNYSS